MKFKKFNESFRMKSNIPDLEGVARQISKDFGPDKMGEENWIDFYNDEPRKMLGTNNETMSFEAIGPNSKVKGSMRTKGNRIHVAIRNGSEGVFDSVEEIEDFIKGALEGFGKKEESLEAVEESLNEGTKRVFDRLTNYKDVDIASAVHGLIRSGYFDDEIVEKILDKMHEYGIKQPDELEEDTVKTSKGKWVNRGDTGKTHGKFNTKKEADAQRKAMYAQGFGESLEESNSRTYVVNSDGEKILYDSAIALMDDGIRERLHRRLVGCTPQEFFTAYEKAHKKKYGKDFVVESLHKNNSERISESLDDLSDKEYNALRRAVKRFYNMSMDEFETATYDGRIPEETVYNSSSFYNDDVIEFDSSDWSQDTGNVINHIGFNIKTGKIVSYVDY